MSELILYTSEDGKTRLDLRADGTTIWLTQLEIAELFQTTKHNASIHTKNIFAEGELTPEATVKESLTVQTEGSHSRARHLIHSLYEQTITSRPGRLVSRIPTGFRPLAQGCAHRATLGNMCPSDTNPNGVVASLLVGSGTVTTPLGFENKPRCSQGRRGAPTLGYEAQSLWDCQTGQRYSLQDACKVQPTPPTSARSSNWKKI